MLWTGDALEKKRKEKEDVRTRELYYTSSN